MDITISTEVAINRRWSHHSGSAHRCVQRRDLYRAYKVEKRRRLRSKLTGTCAHVRIERDGDRFMIVWDGTKPAMSMTAVCTGCGLTCHMDITTSVMETLGKAIHR